MKNFKLLLVALACASLGFFSNFDGWQNNGDFLVNGDVTATTFNRVMVYKAVVSQVGTGTPSSTVLENTTGVTPTWSRNGVGSYTLVFGNGVLVEEKVICSFSVSTGSATQIAKCSAFDDDETFTIFTYSAVGIPVDMDSADDHFCTLTIEIYP